MTDAEKLIKYIKKSKIDVMSLKPWEYQYLCNYISAKDRRRYEDVHPEVTDTKDPQRKHSIGGL